MRHTLVSDSTIGHNLLESKNYVDNEYHEDLGFIFSTREYKRTPAIAIPVPAAQYFSNMRGNEDENQNINCGQVRKPLPRELMGETGVRKKSTEETMTTTRFTQLATEWVTGDTLCNIM